MVDKRLRNLLSFHKEGVVGFYPWTMGFGLRKVPTNVYNFAQWKNKFGVGGIAKVGWRFILLCLDSEKSCE